ncbi:DUF1289 domain-containing protein [Hylemonella sp. W303a]|uniref:DUF1289 domain-containing protein n=1 Tax=Hylemonella sp. W303a TaxID=3389873 RepID=UPI00396B2019
MTYKQAQARWAERVRRLYLPPSDLPVFCALCKVSTSTGLCPVCLRSLEEITNWPRLDDEHRRTVWGRVLMRLDDARQYEQAVRRRVSMRRSARGELPPEPVLTDEVLLVADSGAQAFPEDAPLRPRATEAMVGATSDAPRAGLDGRDAEHAQQDAATPAPTPVDEVAPAIGPLPPAADEPIAESSAALPEARLDTAPDTLVATSTQPGSVAQPSAPPPRPAAAAALPEPSLMQPEVLATHGGVPVDVAAARARQVRLAMAQVVQASLESARREKAESEPGPEEITLKPLI